MGWVWIFWAKNMTPLLTLLLAPLHMTAYGEDEAFPSPLFTPWEGNRKWKITCMEYLQSPSPWGRSTYPARDVIFSPFYWGENWRSGTLSNLPKVIESKVAVSRFKPSCLSRSHILSRGGGLVLIMPILLKVPAKFQQQCFLIHTLWQPVSNRP